MKNIYTMEFLTPAQIAAVLQVSSRTVNRWIDEGKLEAVRLPGINRVSQQAFQDFIKGAKRNG